MAANCCKLQMWWQNVALLSSSICLLFTFKTLIYRNLALPSFAAMKKYQASLCDYPDVWNDAIKQILGTRTWLQDYLSSTCFNQRNHSVLYLFNKDSECSSGLLRAPHGKNCCCYTKWLVVLCTESLIQSPLETVENKLLACIKHYWFVVHRMNIFECVGQVEICFSLWRKCYNEVRVFQVICS